MMKIGILIAFTILTAPSSTLTKHTDKQCRRKIVKNKVDIQKLKRDAMIHNFFNPPQPYIKGDSNLQALFGGSRALQKEFPWVALLFAQDSSDTIVWRCTGVAINEVVMITAAHCIPDADKGSITVLMGFTDRANIGRESRIVHLVEKSEIHVHPDYIEGFEAHDIAIFQYDVKPQIRPPMVGDYPILNNNPDAKYIDRQPCVLLGFGLVGEKYKSRYLQKMTVYISDSDIYSPTLSFRTAKGGPCLGDSGGPLICTIGGKRTVVGLLSLGDGNCDLSPKNGYTMKMSYNIRWIMQTFMTLRPKGTRFKLAIPPNFNG